jgi:hypothetical protein
MRVFISHSKKDRDLAIRIATDLKNNKIAVWFDEWEIFVGDSIVRKLQDGLNSCDFLSIIFTKDSINSNWVEREWQSILYKETIDKNVIIMPIKGDNCELPLILRDKLFADFSKDYKTAINKLIDSINYHHNNTPLLNNDNASLKSDETNEIEIKFKNMDFDSFSEKDKEKVAKAISEMLGISDVIKIINVRKGSVIVRFKFPDEKMVKNFFGKLMKFSNSNIIIEDAWLVGDEKSKIEVSLDEKVFSMEGTANTPTIYLNANTCKGSIKGRIIPENSSELFEPIVSWIKRFLVPPFINCFELDCYFEYFNSSSSQYILYVFRHLDKLHSDGIDITINWYYEEDDEHMLDAGKDFSNRMRKLSFKFIPLEE